MRLAAFGCIAAANALSDVYAMGGTPLTALALLCLPRTLPREVARDILAGSLPLLDGVLGHASLGLVPGAAYANRMHYGLRVLFDPNIPRAMQDVMFDPQTSGGLLVSCPKDHAGELASRAHAALDTAHAVVGRVVERRGMHDMVVVSQDAQ